MKTLRRAVAKQVLSVFWTRMGIAMDRYVRSMNEATQAMVDVMTPGEVFRYTKNMYRIDKGIKTIAREVHAVVKAGRENHRLAEEVVKRIPEKKFADTADAMEEAIDKFVELFARNKVQPKPEEVLNDETV